MSTDILDLMTSLTTLMEHETDALRSGATISDGASIAEAKNRLTATLEKEMARLNRGAVDWLAGIDDDARKTLAEAAQRLEEAAKVNADAIARTLRLSGEIIDAISAEARRVSGQRSVSYHPSGSLREGGRSAPISINTAL